MSLPLSPQVFAILSGLLEEKTGIHHGDLDVLQDKVSVRAEEAGFESLLEYYYFLRYDPAGPAEIDALVEHLVDKETYLFRELDQLQLIVSGLVAPRVKAGRRVRIWSAACATGEEPLSLAMMLAERDLLGGVEIVATDLSQRALDAARTGLLGRRALRTDAPPVRLDRWTEVGADGRLRAAPTLVEAITWERFNLRDRGQRGRFGRFDVILCRNVLIYFRDEVAQEVIEGLSASLAPEGALFVGVSESLLRFGTSLTCEERDGVFFYTKGAA